MSRRFGSLWALQDVELACRPGEVTCLVGPNGSGKSTALALAAGLLPPTAGTIGWGGRSVGPGTAPESTGYLPQTSAFHRAFAVAEVVDFAVAARAAGSADRRQALEVTGLTQVFGRRVGQLSGGWVRRLGLFTALVGAPGLLLLDEPLVGLDPETHDRLAAQLVARLEAGAVVLMASHEFELVDRLSPEVVVLDEGRVRGVFAPGSGASRDLYRRALGQEPAPARKGGVTP